MLSETLSSLSALSSPLNEINAGSSDDQPSSSSSSLLSHLSSHWTHSNLKGELFLGGVYPRVYIELASSSPPPPLPDPESFCKACVTYLFKHLVESPRASSEGQPRDDYDGQQQQHLLMAQSILSSMTSGADRISLMSSPPSQPSSSPSPSPPHAPLIDDVLLIVEALRILLAAEPRLMDVLAFPTALFPFSASLLPLYHRILTQEANNPPNPPNPPDPPNPPNPPTPPNLPDLPSTQTPQQGKVMDHLALSSLHLLIQLARGSGRCLSSMSTSPPPSLPSPPSASTRTTCQAQPLTPSSTLALSLFIMVLAPPSEDHMEASVDLLTLLSGEIWISISISIGVSNLL